MVYTGLHMNIDHARTQTCLLASVEDRDRAQKLEELTWRHVVLPLKKKKRLDVNLNHCYWKYMDIIFGWFY